MSGAMVFTCLELVLLLVWSYVLSLSESFDFYLFGALICTCLEL